MRRNRAPIAILLALLLALADSACTDGAPADKLLGPLQDPPIAGQQRMSLDGQQWVAEGAIRTFGASSTCFNGSAEWLPTPSGFTPDWGTNARSLCGSCNFEENTDYGDPEDVSSDGVTASKMAYSLTPQQCCEVCGADPSCEVAVWSIGHNPWTGSKVGNCILKPAAALAHKTARTNYTAAIPTSRSSWQAVSLNATVPGDLVTDLQRAGIIEDPLFATNFKNATVWSGDGWKYSRSFNLPETLVTPGSSSLLVFDGIKMGAKISLNGVHLGSASDQHRRYVFSVSKFLQATANLVVVSFDSTIDMSDGRYMSCSGGWDWAPYSNLRDPGSGLPTFTKGIWKSVYIVSVESTTAAITSLVPLVKYTGTDWPTTAMKDESSGPFEMTARVFLRSEKPVRGMLTVSGSWGGTATQHISVSGETQVNITLPASSPKLWWARGMGAQSMYNVSATFDATGSVEPVSAWRRVGFRHIALVTVNDSDPQIVAESRLLEGNSNHTLMLRLNGVPLLGKGSNMVPMETLEGRYVAGMHRQIVNSAAQAGMTLLRVWGGGIYPFEEWLDACDDIGVLSMVDMMFGTDGQMPTARATPEQEQEFRDSVRRMAHHPSLSLYYGCNECMGLGVGVLNDFVMRTVASEDNSRPIRSASPWTGYCTGVNRLTGLPNGRNLTSQYWPSCKAPPPPPPPCSTIQNQTACDPERCVWTAGHCADPPPPPPPTPSATCNFTADIDYHGGGSAGIPSASPTACCTLCNATKSCVVGVWVGPPGHCYLKANASQPYSRVGGGRYSCKPNKTYERTYDSAELRSTKFVEMSVDHDSSLHHGEEVHGPYFGGGGWPAINGGGKPFGPKLLIQVPTDLSTIGPAQTGYMRTETGMTSMSSFESMSALLPEHQWGLETESMHSRNYPCHSAIQSFFSAGANMSLSDIGESAFKKQLYLCMLAQAIERKAAIESWRASNVWGLLQWQLNEIWPTGGWGSLEYGTPTVKGQIMGGRWKILHNLMRHASYADVFAGCGVAVKGAASVLAADASSLGKLAPLCYVRNDHSQPFSGTIIVSLVALSTGKTTRLAQINADVSEGGGSTALFCPNGESLLGTMVNTTSVCGSYTSVLAAANCKPTSCFLDVQVTAPNASYTGCIRDGNNQKDTGILYAHNEQLLAAPFQLQLPRIQLSVHVLETTLALVTNDEGGTVDVVVTADSAGVAAYVWLSTLAAGRFEPNGFMMKERNMTVKFVPFEGTTQMLRLLQGSIRVEHLGEHLDRG